MLHQLLSQMKDRFAFGGDAGKDQRVYYFNLKEIIGNKYGTPSEVPFKTYDDTTGLALLVRLRCFGEYSYRMVNPICSTPMSPATKPILRSQPPRQPVEVGTAHSPPAGLC